jgi:hypothetical protein
MYAYGYWCSYDSHDFLPRLVAHLIYPAFANFCCISQDKLLSRMAPETRGQASNSNNPPPPPEPNMTQVLRLMLEDREAARAERQASLATLQQLAQLATQRNNNGGNDEPPSKLREF